MQEEDVYWPTPNERQVFLRIIAAVRGHPDRFASAGAALDRDYSTQALRDREADEWRSHRENPNHNKYSRAYKRKHYPYEQMAREHGIDVSPVEAVPPPPRRQKGADGKPQCPTMSRAARFGRAWTDMESDTTDLSVLTTDKRLALARRRVLLAWLRLDPDRGSIARITEFQGLRTEPTDDDLKPLWMSDDSAPPEHNSKLFVRQDGTLEEDAPTWIAKVEAALGSLLDIEASDPDLGVDVRVLRDFVSEADDLTAAIDKLDGQKGTENHTLHAARERVIRSAASLQKQVGDIRDAVNRQGILTNERKDALANLSRSLDYIAHALRSSLANGWGYRITEECAPPDVVQEWNGHWHTIRHTAIRIMSWTEGMADEPPKKKKRTAKGKGGRPKATEAERNSDQEIYDEWQNAKESGMRTIAEVAEDMKIDRKVFEKAIERHRKRVARAQDRRRTNPGK